MATQEHEMMTLVGEKINEAMESKGMSIRDLSVELGSTYEHVRKIVRGGAVPSKYMLTSICAALKLNPKEMEKLATADRIRHKFGKIPIELSGKNPEMEAIERAWPHLSEDHKKDATSMILNWAKRDKAEAR